MPFKKGYAPWNKGLTKEDHPSIKSMSNKMKNKTGKNNANWKGGKIDNKHGYWLILNKNHPRKNVNNYVFEHILIAEKQLGRYLKHNEFVHHIDGNKKNNNSNNLFVCESNNKIHNQLEQIAFDLYKKGIIKFDTKKGEYFATMEMIRL